MLRPCLTAPKMTKRTHESAFSRVKRDQKSIAIQLLAETLPFWILGHFYLERATLEFEPKSGSSGSHYSFPLSSLALKLIQIHDCCEQLATQALDQTQWGVEARKWLYDENVRKQSRGQELRDKKTKRRDRNRTWPRVEVVVDWSNVDLRECSDRFATLFRALLKGTPSTEYYINLRLKESSIRRNHFGSGVRTTRPNWDPLRSFFVNFKGRILNYRPQWPGIALWSTTWNYPSKTLSHSRKGATLSHLVDATYRQSRKLMTELTIDYDEVQLFPRSFYDSKQTSATLVEIHNFPRRWNYTLKALQTLFHLDLTFLLHPVLEYCIPVT